MWTIEDIKRMFADMGLSSEEDRAKFLRLSEPSQGSSGQRILTFIVATNTTSPQELNQEEEYGQLE